VIERDNLCEHAARMGEHAVQRLQRFAQRCPLAKAVRGKGLFVGVELDGTRGGWFKSAGDVVKACLSRGVLINNAQQWVLRIAPVQVVQQAELDEGVNVVESVIEKGRAS